jgi:hypothetical protein
MESWHRDRMPSCRQIWKRLLGRRKNVKGNNDLSTSYNKAIVSLIMAILVIIDQAFGIKIGVLSEENITIVLAVIWGILVYFVPNAESNT